MPDNGAIGYAAADWTDKGSIKKCGVARMKGCQWPVSPTFFCPLGCEHPTLPDASRFKIGTYCKEVATKPIRHVAYGSEVQAAAVRGQKEPCKPHIGAGSCHQHGAERHGCRGVRFALQVGDGAT